MSERKRGGLDYTPRAFPGARNPDGPAPGLEDELVKLGLAEPKEPKEARADVSPGVKSGATAGSKKRSSLEYTPQAFPGARDPDGPAPGLEERLIELGLAERAEPRPTRPDVRQDAREAPPRPPAPRQQAALPSAPRPSIPVPARREREPPSAPSHPVDARLEPPRRSARIEAPPPPDPTPRPQLFSATPQPVYVVPPPVGSGLDSMIDAAQPPAVGVAPALPRVPPEPAPAPALPRVPPEPAPRPAPVLEDALPVASYPGVSAAQKPASRPSARAARRMEQLKKQPNKEERTRLSLRLVSSVDAKLNDLAHLRGLDRNTAVSVAIVQDWVGCFGAGAGGTR